MKKEMEKNNNNSDKGRKQSWQSKVGMNGGNRQYARSDTPSSILSSDSDIRFTRKLSNQYRSCCYLTASLLVFLLFATLSMFAAHKYMNREGLDDKVFVGVLTVLSGETYSISLTDPETEEFRLTAREYREGLNLWLRRSELKPAFLSTEILAFNGEEGGPVMVHFSARFNPRKLDVSSDDVARVLSRQTHYLGNRTIDPDSVIVNEELMRDSEKHVSTASEDFVTTTPQQPPMRQCDNAILPYCLPTLVKYYNSTSYPNLIGHSSGKHVQDDVIAFREIVDSECYRLSYEFVCHILQPPCSSHLVIPCRSFCQEFWQSCGQRLPPRLQKAFNCSNFPEYSAELPSCIPKPGCSSDLEASGNAWQICDGTADCPDLSDETNCPHCPPGSLPCTTGKACVRPEQQCDGVANCPDASDERACLFLAPDIKSISKLKSVQFRQYHTEGNVIFTEKGSHGKLCIGNLNRTVHRGRKEAILQRVASSLCQTLYFQNVQDVKTDIDQETDSEYVIMEDPSTPEISFIPSKCPSQEILSIKCSDPVCGISTVKKSRGVDGLSKMAAVGDWPWHVALFKAGTHVCDGTLIDVDWVISTASCFQGQGKAEWIVRGGTIRLSSVSPWQQERHIVGMVKSPVEGSTVVLLKLSKPFAPSDFLRPACLPPQGQPINMTYCNTLGWARERTMLQRVEVKMSIMEQCENISIPTVNSICTDSHYKNEDCMEEELAGSPMLCLENSRWILSGVSNWRIACSKIGDRRPRLYDSLISNIDWIKSVLHEDKSR